MKFCGHARDILVLRTQIHFTRGWNYHTSGKLAIFRHNSRAVRDGKIVFGQKFFFFLIRSYHVVENLSLTMQNGEIARWGQSHSLEVNLASEKRLRDTYSLASFIQVILYKIIEFLSKWEKIRKNWSNEKYSVPREKYFDVCIQRRCRWKGLHDLEANTFLLHEILYFFKWYSIFFIHHPICSFNSLEKCIQVLGSKIDV